MENLRHKKLENFAVGLGLDRCEALSELWLASVDHPDFDAPRLEKFVTNRLVRLARSASSGTATDRVEFTAAGEDGGDDPLEILQRLEKQEENEKKLEQISNVFSERPSSFPLAQKILGAASPLTQKQLSRSVRRRDEMAAAELIEELRDLEVFGRTGVLPADRVAQLVLF